MTWFGIDRDRLEIVAGADRLERYASSDHGSRSFCRRCGTSLFCESTRHPDHVDIPLANMEGPIDRDPQLHFYFDSHVDWVSLEDGLPRLGGESGNQPLESESDES